MIESITTLTPAQQVAAVQAQESETNRLRTPETKKGGTDTKNSGNKRQGQLTDFEKMLQKNLAATNQSVHVSVDDVTKRIVVKIVDNMTNEVVKQLPTEEMLRVSRGLAEMESNKGSMKNAGNITDTRI